MDLAIRQITNLVPLPFGHRSGLLVGLQSPDKIMLIQPHDLPLIHSRMLGRVGARGGIRTRVL